MKTNVRPRILLTELIRPAGMALLAQEAVLVVAPDPSPAATAALIGDCDGLIARNTVITRAILAKAPKLKVVATHGAGTDHVDLKAATQQGIFVVNTPGANAESVAEAVVGLMLAVSRKLVQGDRCLREGKDYYSRNRCVGADLHQKTVGIVGMGKIGQKLAGICNQGFEMRVLGYDPYQTATQMGAVGGRKVENLEDLLSQSDFVSLNCPYSSALYQMIDGRRLGLMKSNAILINCARGQLVDEKALYQALKEGVIAGAALDVFEEEPPCFENPLFTLPNIVITPHIAAFAQESIDRMSLISAEDVLKVLHQTPQLAHVVNRELLRTPQ